MKRIAVWNTAFLGDAVLTLPLLQTLKLNYPQAELDFYCREGLSRLFSSHPAVARVFEFKKSGQHKGISAGLGFAREVTERSYDLWISAHRSLRSGIMALYSKAPVRIGYDTPWHSRLWYTHRVPRMFGQLHEVERLLQLVKPLNITNVSDWPEIFPSEDEKRKAEDFFRPLSDNDTPIIGMHPGSIWGTKRWPASYFAELVARVLKMGGTLAVFGGKGEEAAAGEVVEGALRLLGGKEQYAKNIVNLAGKLGLVELGAYISCLSLYVTNDSGPMHIAWAQKVPVIALFGPTIPAFGFAPRGELAMSLSLDLPCKPCGLHGPKVCPLGHHDCMKKLTPDMVWPEIEKLIF